MLMKEIEGLIYDIRLMLSHADRYHTDADRGVNSDLTLEEEGYSSAKRIENLLDCLIDAKHDIDRLRGEMKDMKENLEKLHREAEWENLSSALYK